MTSDLNTPLTKMTGARQTMLSWSRFIDSPEAIPEVFRAAYTERLGYEAAFPYMVFAPAIANIQQITTEKLLCKTNDTIYIWEHNRDRVNLSEYPINAISDLEVGEILLFSWIKFRGATRAGTIACTTVEFNTATSRFFEPFINEIRPLPTDVTKHEQSMEYAKFDNLKTENLKFMNYARNSLVDGERVIQTLWQPKISKPIIKLWGGLFHQVRSLAHLVILTETELIVIADDERGMEKRGVRYGGKWHYIALNNIAAVLLSELAEDLLSLSLTLSPGESQVKIMFAASKRADVNLFKDTLEKLLAERKPR